MTFVDSNPVLAPSPRSPDKGVIGQPKDDTSSNGGNFDSVFKGLEKPELPKQVTENLDNPYVTLADVLPTTEATHRIDTTDKNSLPKSAALETLLTVEPIIQQGVRVTDIPARPKTEPSLLSDTKDTNRSVDDMLEMLQAAPTPAPVPPSTQDTVLVNSVSPQPQLMPLVADNLPKSAAIGRSDINDRKSAVSTASSATQIVERSDTDAPMPTEVDRTFRFARADGKGASVNVAISALAEGARKDTTAVSGEKVETVTVLDSRRYLGLPATNNVALISSALAKETTALVQTAQPSLIVLDDATSKVVNTLKLQLTPVELGSVVATLRLSGEALSVDLRVETGAAFRQLSDDQSAIIKTLQAQGFEIDQINVRLVSSDIATVQTDNQAGQQPRQGQQGSFAQSQQQQGNPHSSSRDERRTREESRLEQTADLVSDNGVRGGVYL